MANTSSIKRYTVRLLNRRGYYDIRTIDGDASGFEAFRERSRHIMARHKRQDETTVARLRTKYSHAILGEVSVYRLLELLAQVIDPTNHHLCCTSQLTHTLQVLDSMEEAGISYESDPDLVVAALIHDLGKLALLTGELPEHVEGGGKIPLGSFESGAGFSACEFTWDHGDITHARFEPYLSESVAWLVRYHSITDSCLPLMDESDRERYETLYRRFIVHDRTYKFHYMPSKQLADYREIIEDAFPDPVRF